MEGNQQQFWQFSDQLRLQTSNLADLSLSDSIWSVNSFGTKKYGNRRNFDIRVGGDTLNNNNNNPEVFNNNNNNNNIQQKGSLVNSSGSGGGGNSSNNEYNVFNDGWKGNLGINLNLNGGFNKGVYFNSKPSNNYNNVNDYNNGYNNNGGGFGLGVKGSKNISLDEQHMVVSGGKHGKKNKDVRRDNNNVNVNKEFSKDGNGESKSGVDKRFKTLPASESLPRNEAVGGYIFVCNNDTMEENLKRQLFGLPPRYRDSVRQITPGLPLFLYNYSTHQLHGIYEAASFGGTNIDPTAWEDKKNPGESRFPAQVQVQNRKLCEPLDEDAFRPILHHYDGPKFRLELSVPEALSLLDIFAEST